MRALVLGASGMLGSAVFWAFDKDASHEVWGLMRNESLFSYFSPIQRLRILLGVDVLDEVSLCNAFERVRPDVVINCVGLIKQKIHTEDPLAVLPINAMLPHQLAAFCVPRNIRLIQISTDCVFSGRKGMYTEAESSDAEDLYGKSKYIGELRDHKNAVTLRTSIVGRELNTSRALIDWFLAQHGVVHGFRRSIFSGITTLELAHVIRDVILPNAQLHGLYHISSAPISKFELLTLVATEYQKIIEVLPDDQLVIDRSLDSTRFYKATGYLAPTWKSMLRTMHTEEKY